MEEKFEKEMKDTKKVIKIQNKKVEKMIKKGMQNSPGGSGDEGQGSKKSLYDKPDFSLDK